MNHEKKNQVIVEKKELFRNHGHSYCVFCNTLFLAANSLHAMYNFFLLFWLEDEILVQRF